MLEADPSLMALRRSTVEHPFDTIKAWMGATHYRMRRPKNVRTEIAFHVLAYNIKRVIALVGVRRLLDAIRPELGCPDQIVPRSTPQDAVLALLQPIRRDREQHTQYVHRD